MKLPQALLSAMQRRAERRMDTPPSKRIGERYLTRWHLLPKNRLFNVYLHLSKKMIPTVISTTTPGYSISQLYCEGAYLRPFPARHVC